MNFWTAVVIIVAIAAFVKLRTAKYHADRGIIVDNTGNQRLATPAVDAESQRELEDLRRRLQVLERIVTEDRRSNDIAREIESLRDS